MTQRNGSDRAPRFAWLERRLRELEDTSLRRRLITCAPTDTPLVIEREGRRLLNFGSNDYLGLAARRSVAAAAAGSGASALVCGYGPLHRQLEAELAELEGTEAAVLLPTGYAANLAVISTLAGEGDLILSDALNHASIVDGCRLSRAERMIYPHADTAAVGALLEHHRDRYQRVFLVTDALFSMDGDPAPMAELAALADAYDAILIADEAHGTGVFGATGSGVCEATGTKGQVPIRVGTLSKAVGALGGFVAGPQPVIDYLVSRARPLIYSTAVPETVVRAALSGLESIRTEPQRREGVLRKAAQLRDRLRTQGIRIQHHDSQIIIVPIGDNARSVAVSLALSEAGFFIPAIRPPTVPRGTARLRLSISDAHTPEQIDAVADALATCLASPKDRLPKRS